MTEQEQNNQIRGEEDTTNIRRIGAKDRKKRVQMTGTLFPDEPAEETKQTAPLANPSEPRPNGGGETAVRPDTASKRPTTATMVATVAKPSTLSKRSAVKPKRRSSNALLYNLIALAFVLATVGVLIYFVFLWNNYNSPLNPFAPPTPMPNFIIVTPSS